MLDARSDTNVLIMRRPFKVLISLVTLVAFLFNTVSYDLAWAVRDSAGLPSVGSERAGGPGSTKELRVDTFMLPANLGTVQYAVAADHGAADTVVHIQDAHCNYAAQKKIAEIIDYMHTQYGVRTVNVEGGAKQYDLSVFTDIGDKVVREKVADRFVSEGTVNGAEYYAINNPDKVDLWGIEDASLYIKNLNVYKDSLGHKEEVGKVLKSLDYILGNLKAHIYSKALLDFDTKYLQYKANSLQFKDYLNYLIGKAKDVAIDVKSFTDIYLLSQALEAETGIEFSRANSERDALVDMLQKKLSKKSLEELVVKTVEFRSDKLSHKEFYSYLADKARGAGVDLVIFPELQKYIVYISMYDAIDKSKIMAELEILEDGIRSALCENDEQRELALLSKNLALLRNFFNISLTRSDYEYYRRSDESFDMGRYTDFINKSAPLYKVSAQPDPAIVNIDEYRRQMAQFYEYSFMRDDVFVKNMKFTEENEKTSQKPSRKWTVVVTGGFHTDSLRDLFKKKGISYISVLPNFKSADGSESVYFKLLAGGEGTIEHSIDAALSSLQVASLLNDLGTRLSPKRAELLRLGVLALESLYTDQRPRAFELTDKKYGYVLFELNDKGEPVCRALKRGEELPAGTLVADGKYGKNNRDILRGFSEIAGRKAAEFASAAAPAAVSAARVIEHGALPAGKGNISVIRNFLIEKLGIDRARSENAYLPAIEEGAITAVLYLPGIAGLIAYIVARIGFVFIHAVQTIRAPPEMGAFSGLLYKISVLASDRGLLMRNIIFPTIYSIIGTATALIVSFCNPALAPFITLSVTTIVHSLGNYLIEGIGLKYQKGVIGTAATAISPAEKAIEYYLSRNADEDNTYAAQKALIVDQMQSLGMSTGVANSILESVDNNVGRIIQAQLSNKKITVIRDQKGRPVGLKGMTMEAYEYKDPLLGDVVIKFPRRGILQDGVTTHYKHVLVDGNKNREAAQARIDRELSDAQRQIMSKEGIGAKEAMREAELRLSETARWRVARTYEISRNKLGRLFAPIILKDLVLVAEKRSEDNRLVVDADGQPIFETIRVPYAVVQQKVKPLAELFEPLREKQAEIKKEIEQKKAALKSLGLRARFGKGREDARQIEIGIGQLEGELRRYTEEDTALLRKYYALQKDMARRGVVDKDSALNFVSNYGVTDDGSIVGFDVDFYAEAFYDKSDESMVEGQKISAMDDAEMEKFNQTHPDLWIRLPNVFHNTIQSRMRIVLGALTGNEAVLNNKDVAEVLRKWIVSPVDIKRGAVSKETLNGVISDLMALDVKLGVIPVRSATPAAQSLLTNIFTGKYSLLNWIARILVSPATVAHELGHAIWAWRTPGLEVMSIAPIRGETVIDNKTGVKSSAEIWGGIVGNAIAAALSGAVLTVLLLVHAHISFAIPVLSYLVVANIVSLMAEIVGARFGRGDMAGFTPDKLLATDSVVQDLVVGGEDAATMAAPAAAPAAASSASSAGAAASGAVGANGINGDLLPAPPPPPPPHNVTGAIETTRGAEIFNVMTEADIATQTAFAQEALAQSVRDSMAAVPGAGLGTRLGRLVAGIFIGKSAGLTPLKELSPPQPIAGRQISAESRGAWLTRSGDNETTRRIRSTMFDNLHYVSFATFNRELGKCLERFNAAVGRKPYAVIWDGEAHKSKRWVYELAKDRLATRPRAGVYFENDGLSQTLRTKARLESLAKSGIRTFVIFDDAMYSGLDVGGMVEGIMKMLPGKKINIIIVSPYVTQRAIEIVGFQRADVRHIFEQRLKTVEDIVGNEDMKYVSEHWEDMNEDDKRDLERAYMHMNTLTYFEHKVPDNVSFSEGLMQYITGSEATPYKRPGTSYYENEESDFLQSRAAAASTPVSSQFRAAFNIAAVVPVFFVYLSNLEMDFLPFMGLASMAILLVFIVHEAAHAISAIKQGAKDVGMGWDPQTLVSVQFGFETGTPDVARRLARIISAPYKVHLVAAAVSEMIARFLLPVETPVGIFLSIYAYANLAFALLPIGLDGTILFKLLFSAQYRREVQRAVDRGDMDEYEAISALPEGGVKSRISNVTLNIAALVGAILISFTGPNAALKMLNPPEEKQKDERLEIMIEPPILESLAPPVPALVTEQRTVLPRAARPAVAQAEPVAQQAQPIDAKTLHPEIADAALVIAHIQRESGNDPMAVGAANDVGSIQLLPATARQYGLVVDSGWERALNRAIKYVKRDNKTHQRSRWSGPPDGKRALRIAAQIFWTEKGYDRASFNDSDFSWLIPFDGRLDQKQNITAATEFINDLYGYYATSDKYRIRDRMERIKFVYASYRKGMGNVRSDIDLAKTSLRRMPKFDEVYKTGNTRTYVNDIINGAVYTNSLLKTGQTEDIVNLETVRAVLAKRAAQNRQVPFAALTLPSTMARFGQMNPILRGWVAAVTEFTDSFFGILSFVKAHGEGNTAIRTFGYVSMWIATASLFVGTMTFLASVTAVPLAGALALSAAAGILANIVTHGVYNMLFGIAPLTVAVEKALSRAPPVLGVKSLPGQLRDFIAHKFTDNWQKSKALTGVKLMGITAITTVLITAVLHANVCLAVAWAVSGIVSAILGAVELKVTIREGPKWKTVMKEGSEKFVKDRAGFVWNVTLGSFSVLGKLVLGTALVTSALKAALPAIVPTAFSHALPVLIITGLTISMIIIAVDTITKIRTGKSSTVSVVLSIALIIASLFSVFGYVGDLAESEGSFKHVAETLKNAVRDPNLIGATGDTIGDAIDRVGKFLKFSAEQRYRAMSALFGASALAYIQGLDKSQYFDFKAMMAKYDKKEFFVKKDSLEKYFVTDVLQSQDIRKAYEDINVTVPSFEFKDNVIYKGVEAQPSLDIKNIEIKLFGEDKGFKGVLRHAALRLSLWLSTLGGAFATFYPIISIRNLLLNFAFFGFVNLFAKPATPAPATSAPGAALTLPSTMERFGQMNPIVRGWLAAVLEFGQSFFGILSFVKAHGTDNRGIRTFGYVSMWLATAGLFVGVMPVLATFIALPLAGALAIAAATGVLGNIVTHGIYNTLVQAAPLTLGVSPASFINKLVSGYKAAGIRRLIERSASDKEAVRSLTDMARTDPNTLAGVLKEYLAKYLYSKEDVEKGLFVLNAISASSNRERKIEAISAVLVGDLLDLLEKGERFGNMTDTWKRQTVEIYIAKGLEGVSENSALAKERIKGRLGDLVGRKLRSGLSASEDFILKSFAAIMPGEVAAQLEAQLAADSLLQPVSAKMPANILGLMSVLSYLENDPRALSGLIPELEILLANKDKIPREAWVGKVWEGGGASYTRKVVDKRDNADWLAELLAKVKATATEASVSLEQPLSAAGAVAAPKFDVIDGTPLRINTTTQIDGKDIQKIASAVAETHKAWTGPIINSCALLSRIMGRKVDEAFAGKGDVRILGCGSIHEKKAGLAYPENWESAIFWGNHFVTYLEVNGLHIAIDTTAKYYTAEDKTKAYGEVFIASSFDDLENMLSLRYGGKEWNVEDSLAKHEFKADYPKDWQRSYVQNYDWADASPAYREYNFMRRLETDYGPSLEKAASIIKAGGLVRPDSMGSSWVSWISFVGLFNDAQRSEGILKNAISNVVRAYGREELSVAMGSAITISMTSAALTLPSTMARFGQMNPIARGWVAAVTEFTQSFFGILSFVRAHGETNRGIRTFGYISMWITTAGLFVGVMPVLASFSGIPLAGALAIAAAAGVLGNIVTHGIYNTLVQFAPLTLEGEKTVKDMLQAPPAPKLMTLAKPQMAKPVTASPVMSLNLLGKQEGVLAPIPLVSQGQKFSDLNPGLKMRVMNAIKGRKLHELPAAIQVMLVQHAIANPDRTDPEAEAVWTCVLSLNPSQASRESEVALLRPYLMKDAAPSGRAKWQGKGHRMLLPETIVTDKGSYSLNMQAAGAFTPQLLGEGAYASVFKAKDPAGKDVVIKLLYDDPETVIQSFLEYLKMLRAGNIDSAVSAYDTGSVAVTRVGRTYNYHFIVQEFADGGTLSDEFKRRHDEVKKGSRKKVFSRSEVKDIARQLLGALRALHSRGIVHLDLKPENIFIFYVDGKMKVKLGDFGISEHLPASGVLDLKSFKGTLNYSPKKSLSGKYGIDTDMHALSCIMYELLHGNLPWKASTPTKQQILDWYKSLRDDSDPTVRKNSRLVERYLERKRQISEDILQNSTDLFELMLIAPMLTEDGTQLKSAGDALMVMDAMEQTEKGASLIDEGRLAEAKALLASLIRQYGDKPGFAVALPYIKSHLANIKRAEDRLAGIKPGSSDMEGPERVAPAAPAVIKIAPAFKVPPVAGAVKLNKDYTPGSYETRVTVEQGKVSVAPYDEQGVKTDQEVIVTAGNSTVATGRVEPLAAPATGAGATELLGMAEEILTAMSKDDLLTAIRNISGDKTLEWADIASDPSISYFAEGAHKYVFKVTFKTRRATSVEILLAAKKEKTKGDIARHELQNLKKLNGRGVPKFGGSFQSKDGRMWYVEEFIEGDTLNALDRKGLLADRIRKNIVSTLLAISLGINGMVPRDMHGENFIVRKGSEEVVMVDIGDKRLYVTGKESTPSNRLMFLAMIMSQYGYKDSASPERDHFIFDAIMEYENPKLSKEEKLQLLKDSYDEYKRMGKTETVRFFIEKGRNMFWNLGARSDNLKPIQDFTDTFGRSLGSYLAKVEMRRGPPTAAQDAAVTPDLVERIAVEAHRIRATDDMTDPNFAVLSESDKAANRESAAIAARIVIDTMEKMPISDMRKALDEAVDMLRRGQPITAAFADRADTFKGFVLASGVAQHEAWRQRKLKAGQLIKPELAGAFEDLNAAEQKKDLNFMLAAVNAVEGAAASAAAPAAPSASLTLPSTMSRFGQMNPILRGWVAAVTEFAQSFFGILSFVRAHGESNRGIRTFGYIAMWLTTAGLFVGAMPILATFTAIPLAGALAIAAFAGILGNIVTHGLYNTLVTVAALTVKKPVGVVKMLKLTSDDIEKLIEANRSVRDIVLARDGKGESQYYVSYRLPGHAPAMVSIAASVKEFQEAINSNKIPQDHALEKNFESSQAKVIQMAKDNPEWIASWEITTSGEVKVTGKFTRSGTSIDPSIPSAAALQMDNALAAEKEAQEAQKIGVTQAEMDAQIFAAQQVMMRFLDKAYPGLQMLVEPVKGKPGSFRVYFEESTSETLPIGLTLGATEEQLRNEVESKVPSVISAHRKYVEEREGLVRKELEALLAKKGVVGHGGAAIAKLAKRINNAQWSRKRMEEHGKRFDDVDLLRGLDLPEQLFRGQEALEKLLEEERVLDLKRANLDPIKDSAEIKAISAQIDSKARDMAPMQKAKAKFQAELFKLGGPIADFFESYEARLVVNMNPFWLQTLRKSLDDWRRMRLVLADISRQETAGADPRAIAALRTQTIGELTSIYANLMFAWRNKIDGGYGKIDGEVFLSRFPDKELKERVRQDMKEGQEAIDTLMDMIVHSEQAPIATEQGRLDALHKRMIPILRDMLNKKGPGSKLVIVDFGIGGDGAPTVYDLEQMLMNEKGKDGRPLFNNVEIIGVDQDEVCINEARAKLEEGEVARRGRGFTMEFRQGLFDLANQGIASADMVIAANVFLPYLYVETRDTDMRLLRQALGQEGVLVVANGPYESTPGMHYIVYAKDGKPLQDVEIFASEAPSIDDLRTRKAEAAQRAEAASAVTPVSPNARSLIPLAFEGTAERPVAAPVAPEPIRTATLSPPVSTAVVPVAQGLPATIMANPAFVNLSKDRRIAQIKVAVAEKAGQQDMAEILFADGIPSLRVPLNISERKVEESVGNHTKLMNENLTDIAYDLVAFLMMRGMKEGEASDRVIKTQLVQLSMVIRDVKWANRRAKNGEVAEKLMSRLSLPMPEKLKELQARELAKLLAGMGTKDNYRAAMARGLDVPDIIAAPDQQLVNGQVEARRNDTVNAIMLPDNRDAVVKIVVGVPAGQDPEKFNRLNRELMKRGLGATKEAKVQDAHIVVFEIFEGDAEKTRKSMDAAIDRAGIAGVDQGRVVVFAPQMGNGLDLAVAAQEAYGDRKYITILQDAYSDFKVVNNIFPDLLVRVALARNIAFYYTTGSDKEKVLVNIQELLNKIASDADGILAVKDGLITFLRPLRIKPVNYKDITDWHNMQEATAASA